MFLSKLSSLHKTEGRDKMASERIERVTNTAELYLEAVIKITGSYLAKVLFYTDDQVCFKSKLELEYE